MLAGMRFLERFRRRPADAVPPPLVTVTAVDPAVHNIHLPGTAAFRVSVSGYPNHQVDGLYAIVGGRIHVDDIRNYSDTAGLGALIIDAILAEHPDLPRRWTASAIKPGGAAFWERMRETRGIDLTDGRGVRLPYPETLRGALEDPSSSTMRPNHQATVRRLRQGV